MSRRAFLIPLAILLVAGCEFPAVSVQPLYTEEDLVGLPVLEGRWSDQEELVMEFSRVAPGTFALAIIPDQSDGALRSNAYVLELDGQLYLDLSPDTDVWDELDSQAPFPMLPTHLWFAMELRGDTLVLETVSRDAWLELLPAQDADFVVFEGEDGTEYLVLPQATRELQGVVSRVFGTPEVDRDRLVLLRARG